MKPILRENVLFIEAVVLIGPVSAFCVYCLILAVLFGYPSLFIARSTPSQEFNFQFAAALTAIPMGSIGIWQLWSITRSTAKRHVHQFGRGFWSAIACGAVAAVALTAVLRLFGFALFVAPALILLAHMSYLQGRLRKAIQLGIQPDVPASGRSAG